MATEGGIKLYPKGVRTYGKKGTEGVLWAEKISGAKDLTELVTFRELRGPVWLEQVSNGESIM